MRDDLLRETLSRAAGSEPAAGDSWARFVARRRRAGAWRNATVAMATVVAAFALVRALPGATGTDADFFGDVTARVEGLSQQYVDPVAGFRLRYPAGWNALGTPGASAWFAPPETSRADAEGDLATPADPFRSEPGGYAFQVAVRTTGADDVFIDVERAMYVRAGARTTERPIEVAGADVALTIVEFGAAPATGAVAPRFWCARCTLEVATLDLGDGWRAEIRSIGPTATFGRYRDVGARIRSSFARAARVDGRLSR